MTKNNSRHLLYMLSEFPDFRKPRGKRHPLPAVLGLSIIALMCGYRSYSAIAEYGRTCDRKLLEDSLGFTHPKTPCASTLHHFLKNIDSVALEKVLGEWAKAVLAEIPGEDTTAVALDGKTLIGSAKQGATISHLLSAVSHQLGITLAQQPVATKTNEIPVSTQILQAFQVRGKIVTTDALLTQRAFSQNLCQAEADYVMPVKGNQKCLYADIQCLFQLSSETLAFAALHEDLQAHFDTYTSVEKAHGFITTRTLTTSTSLTDYLTWPGLAQVYEYRCQRQHTRTGKTTHQTQYGITSLSPQQASAERLLKLQRGHWTIENLSHRTRDMIFGEDASQVRSGNIPQVMAALRNSVLTPLRVSGYTQIAKTLRYFATHPWQALNLIQNIKYEN